MSNPNNPVPVADLIIRNIGRLVTMDASRSVFSGAAIAIRDGRIVQIGSEADIGRAFANTHRLDARGGWVLPGMVDAHQHLTGDRLARASIPDTLAPGAAIFEWAVPLHAAHTPEDDRLSSTLAALEAAHNGVTSIVEAGTVAHPDQVAAGVSEVGIRTSIGRWGWDVEDGPFAGPPADVIARASDLLDRHPPDSDGLVRGWVTLVGHDLMSDELLRGATALARERRALMTFHLSPSGSDAVSYMARTGRRPVVHLDDLGVLGPHLLVAHGVHLDDIEVNVLLENDVAIASCPWAYLRLGQGFGRAGRHAEFVARGGRLALGCDSENAGDQIDVLRAAALFAGMAKDANADPTMPGAHLALELATIRGAQAIGRGDDLGSLEVGKRADLVVFNPDRPEWRPVGDDVALQLVWGTDGRSVRDVIVAGEIIVRDGRSTRVDEGELATRAIAAGASLRERAGVPVVAQWPVRRA